MKKHHIAFKRQLRGVLRRCEQSILFLAIQDEMLLIQSDRFVYDTAMLLGEQINEEIDR